MINKILVLASLFFFLGTTNSEAQRPHEYDNFKVMVEGLGCPFCAYGLEKKFKELKGLKKPVIDMETGKFTFQYPTAEKMSSEKVAKQVTAAGYTAVKIDIVRANGTVESSEETNTLASDNLKEEAMKVAGNCGMCRARIEQAAKSVKGVQTAAWEEESNLLTIEFDAQKTSLEKVAQAVAKAGHDSDLSKAKTTTYEQLPPCCLYR